MTREKACFGRSFTLFLFAIAGLPRSPLESQVLLLFLESERAIISFIETFEIANSIMSDSSQLPRRIVKVRGFQFCMGKGRSYSCQIAMTENAFWTFFEQPSILLI